MGSRLQVGVEEATKISDDIECVMIHSLKVSARPLEPLRCQRDDATQRCVDGTEEMMQPCLIHLHAIFLVGHLLKVSASP